MLRIKRGMKTVLALTLCMVMGTCAAAPATGSEEKGASTENVGLTIQKEKSSETLYTGALETTSSGTQKFTTVRRGDFVIREKADGEVVYPDKKTVRYYFPYGTTYYIEAVGVEKRNKEAGEPIARIHVEMDEVQLALTERQLQRMEERGEAGAAYEEALTTFVEMQKASKTTEIVMEEDGILLEQEFPRFASQISSYTIVVANPEERLLQVNNEGKKFRYGQNVTVTAKIDGKTQTGTGTVITASQGTVSEELSGTTALIRLDEECEYLYDGADISVYVETIHMKDVLLLDANAVFMSNGTQMVKIKDEYGLHAVGFTFGRKTESVYWVVDGLEEGAQILVQ